MLVAWITALIILFNTCQCNHDAKRLYDDLLRKSKYNKLIRPVGNSSDKLTVKLGLKLSQLIDVDEKNEIITTNMWVIQEWEDYSLRWEPHEYGNVSLLYVPSESIWLPDIVLYNNADGDYTVTLMTKARLSSSGKVVWEPPAIYKSQCDINVKFFPFDEQECKLKFGSWTYDGFQVDLKYISAHKYIMDEQDEINDGVDLSDYYPSVEWNVMKVSSKKTNKFYPCCKEPYPDITFKIKIRRKTLFYTLNLIIPCVSINLLTILIFYLPSDSGEKISLCISLLLSLSIFQLLLMDLVPATSLTIPLLAKYILFTMIMVSVSVFVSVMTLNFNFRSGSTHTMHPLIRKIFLKVLPRLLCMHHPNVHDDLDFDAEVELPEHPVKIVGPNCSKRRNKNYEFENIPEDRQHLNIDTNYSSTFIGGSNMLRNIDMRYFCNTCKEQPRYPLNVKKAAEGTLFIAKHLKDEMDCSKVKDDWRYIGLVLDRIFLYIYFIICSAGSISILARSPVLYDDSLPMDRKSI